MALLRRSVPWRALLSNRRGFSSATESSDLDEVSDGEFRKLQLYQSQKERQVKKKMDFGEVVPDRATQMRVDQDWPSVWPAAASFKPSVVPLPIRMGFEDKSGRYPPGKHCNVELMKIPNFLHLTPPAIERHCQALKKFCNKWPEALTDERSRNWITIITSDYVHA
ncbi:28S ribosomal protein S35, partial [Tropilaelaps mercedesae]